MQNNIFDAFWLFLIMIIHAIIGNVCFYFLLKLKNKKSVFFALLANVVIFSLPYVLPFIKKND